MTGGPKKKCTSTSSQTGKPCGNWPVRGATVCVSHGGRAPQVKRKAEQRLIEAAAAEAIEKYQPNGAAPVDDPVSALLAIAGEITSFKDFIAARVSEMRVESWRYEGEGAEQLRAEIAVYERALDRTAKVLVDINKLGLKERQIQLAAEHGVLLAGAIQKILSRLELSEEQRSLVPTVVPQVLRSIAGGGA